jgi:tetraacyldisaccharide 4'-kinase
MARRHERWLARRGGAAELLRVPALLFGAASALRASLYDRRWLPVARVDAPVVSVGNASVGGTGKTPMVAWVVHALLARGFRPGILARGYGGRGGPNDESRLLGALHPDVPRVEDKDRVRGALQLIARGADAVVLDDGFQHRRLHRDLDLVLVDATRPWGLPAPPEGGAPVRALLPRGFLRERPAALARADALVVTRADQVSAAELAALEVELERLAPGRPICRARHRPMRLRAPDGAPQHPSVLSGREVDLVSGIGNPEAFEATARSLGARVAEHRALPDHQPFGERDLAGLGAGGRWIVTTAKDAARLGTDPARARLHVLEVELAVDEGAPVLAALFEALPLGAARRERRAFHEGLHG